MHKDYKFREYYRKKNRNACFRCTVKTCKARIETNDVIAVAEYEDHDHSDIVSNVAAVALRVCKKLVTQQLSQLYTFARNVYSCERHITASVQDYSDCTTVHCCYISWRSGHVPRYSELSGCNVGPTEKLFATCLYSVYDGHFRCCAFGVMSCGFIDSTFALLLKIHLRFRGSFLRFHSMAVLTPQFCHSAYVVALTSVSTTVLHYD